MNTATKPVSMARTAPRHVSAKDYSEFKVEGRHGKVDSRTRKQNAITNATGTKKIKCR